MASGRQQILELDREVREVEAHLKAQEDLTQLQAQEEDLVQGRSHGGLIRRAQLGEEGYREMGRKEGLSTNDESGDERAAKEGIDIDESKFRTKS